MGHAVAGVVGAEPLTALSKGLEQLIGARVPKWNPSVPHPTPNVASKEVHDPQVVYFPSCISRTMGGPSLDERAPSLTEVFIQVAQRAGLNVLVPEDGHGVCCGMPFSSKGYTEAYRDMLHRTLERMWIWSQGGNLPIVIDASSCAYSLRIAHLSLVGADLQRWKKLTLLDSVEFAQDWLIPNLNITPITENVVLHPNCALRKLNLDASLRAVVQACATSVVVPENLGCCGFAGDRGLLFPELTESATQLEAKEVLSQDFEGYYSSNLTCEMGMSLATGKPYRSFLYLLEEVSRPSSSKT
jgi:D-lactate dehydrogenase